MTREEKEQTGKYVLQMARLLEDGCYQQEMLLKAVHIIDEALEQEPTEKMHSKTCGTCRHFRKHRNKRNIEICKELYGENTTCGHCTYWEDSYEVALPTTENDYCSHHRGLEE